MLSKFKKEWKTISWKLDKIYIISRYGNSPFVVKKTIPIGGSKASSAIQAPPIPVSIAPPVLVSKTPVPPASSVPVPTPAPVPSTQEVQEEYEDDLQSAEWEEPAVTSNVTTTVSPWAKPSGAPTNGNANANGSPQTPPVPSNSNVGEALTPEPGGIISSTSERLAYLRVKAWVEYLVEQGQPLPKTREKFKNAITK